MIRHRPCGECRALVPADGGCKHWNPRTRVSRQSRAEAARKEREAVKDFGRAMRGERR